MPISYPNGEGKKFDMDYYSTKHMPMIASLLGDSLKMFEIDKGIAGRAPTVQFLIWLLDTYTLTGFPPFKIHSAKQGKNRE